MNVLFIHYKIFKKIFYFLILLFNHDIYTLNFNYLGNYYLVKLNLVSFFQQSNIYKNTSSLKFFLIILRSCYFYISYEIKVRDCTNFRIII